MKRSDFSRGGRGLTFALLALAATASAGKMSADDRPEPGKADAFVHGALRAEVA